MSKSAIAHFFSIRAFNTFSLLLASYLLIMAVSGVHNSIINIIMVGLFEICCISFYALKIRQFSAIRLLWGGHRIVLLGIGLWFLSVSLSFYLSVSREGIPTHQLQAIVASYVMFLLHIAFGFCVASFLMESRFNASKYLYSLCVGVFLLCVYMAFMLMSHHEGMSYYWRHYLPFAINIRHVGYWVTAGATGAFALLLVESQPRRVLALYLIAVVSAGMLIWMGGRTGTLSWLVAVIAMLFVAGLTKRVNLRRGTIFISAMLVALWLSYVCSLYDWNGIFRVASTVTELGASGDAVEFTQGRTDLWRVAMSAWQTSPWFGLGANAFLFLPDRPHGIHPHNFIVQLLLEWGVVGFGLFLIVFVYACCLPLIKVFKQRYIAKNQLVAGAILLSLLIHALTDGIFWYARPLMIMSLALAIYLTAAGLDAEQTVFEQEGCN